MSALLQTKPLDCGVGQEEATSITLLPLHFSQLHSLSTGVTSKIYISPCTAVTHHALENIK